MYAREIDEHKRTLLLINKADLLPGSVRLVAYVASLQLICSSVFYSSKTCVAYCYYYSFFFLNFFVQEEMVKVLPSPTYTFCVLVS